MRKRAADMALGALARGGAAVIGVLPPRMASDLGGWLAQTIGPRLKVSETARRNLRAAFPQWTPARVEGVLHQVWDNFGRTVFEFPHLDKLTFDGPDPDVTVTGAEHIYALRDDGAPGIFYSGHLANWEVLAVTALHHGIDLDLVYRAPNNPAAEEVFSRRRLGRGELIPKGAKGARRVLKRLGEGRHLGLLADQKMNDGAAAPFFGRPAMTAPALAQLALRFKCPVSAARIERRGAMKFHVTVHAPEVFEQSNGGGGGGGGGETRAADVLKIMTDVNARLESWIRERPGEWLWLHKRWPD
ncbi:MAG: LpxL/LpxP family acyltransferase [Rhodospirillales bacterium]